MFDDFKLMNNYIFHIYWGTAGNAGLYLDEIYKVLENAGFKQKAFVNYYYPFDYGEKFFYKYTELGHCKVKRFRGPIRYLELLWALFRILVRTIIDKPNIINYSLIGSFDIVSYYLHFAQKVLGCKIVLTCHDVMPFASANQSEKSEMAIRNKLVGLADYLLVHNDFSKKTLQEVYAVKEERIIMHPFPVMDLSNLIRNIEKNYSNSDFLFIGHLRREKGVDILLKAWEIVHKECPKAILRVAGNLPSIENLDLTEYKGRTDVEFILQFLTDEEYCGLIKATRYVVLPYKYGTNSGVVSTVLSLNSEVIASDIPMFEQNSLLNQSMLFKSEDVLSLAESMINAYVSSNESNDAKERVSRYRDSFSEEVINVYNSIL